MTASPEEEGKDKGGIPAQNILYITDELVRQVGRTKKLVVIMIVAIVVAIPVTWHAAPLVSGDSFMFVGYVTIAIALTFLAVGVRQWFVLSKWTRRYKQFKQLQQKVDQRLDFESEGETPS